MIKGSQLSPEAIKIINNYENILLKQFEKLGLSIEYSRNFKLLKDVLLSAPDYEYEYDSLFEEEELDPKDGMAIFIRDSKEMVATYSYRLIDFEDFANGLKDWVTETNGEWLFKKVLEGQLVYSSCQWVKTSHRNSGLGQMADQLKKVHSLRTFGWDFQFSHCRAHLHRYHLSNLKYAHSELAFKSHSVAGSGTFADKEYYINWISQQEYLNLISR